MPITNQRKINKKNLLSVICYLLSENVGQTMLEVLVALSLIILFLSGVVVIQLFAIRNVEYAQNRSLATKLARQQLDRAKVVRDSAGFDALSNCQLTLCFINDKLTPGPTPTGTFSQSFQILTSGDCPNPTITPVPTIYKAVAVVSWGGGKITPPPEVQLSTCITDWR